MKIAKRLAAGLLGIWLAGCAITRPVQGQLGEEFLLGDGGTIGQTFVAGYDGLSGIEIFRRGGEAGSGQVTLTIRDAPDGQILLEQEYELSPLVEGGVYRLTFPAIKASSQQYLYVELEIEKAVQFTLRGGPGESYLNGSSYQNGQPADGQLGFRMVYDLPWLVLGLSLEGLRWLLIGLALLFILVLPGWALLESCWPNWNLHSGMSKFCLAASTGLALYPLLIMLTGILGLKLGAFYAWAPPLISILYLVSIAVKGRFLYKQGTTYQERLISLDAENWLLIGLLVLLFLTRFWVIRGLDAPMWGDSVQHSIITQLLVDNKGLFTSWIPYAEIETFTYHFGFHSVAACLVWLSGLSAEQAVMWTGQFLNILAVLALYPMAKRMSNQSGAVSAILIAGFLAPMPMFYTNWGRYTQLAGQVLLPVVLLLLWDVFEPRPPGRHWRRRILLGILLAGLAMLHYRVIIFAGLFLIVNMASTFRHKDRAAIWKDLFWMAAVAGMLFLPWFFIVFGGRILTIFHAQITTSAGSLSEAAAGLNSIGDLSFFLPAWIWILSAGSIVWGLLRREINILQVTMWSLLTFLLANPSWLGIPGDGALSNFAVLIAAYIPAALLAGWSIGRLRTGIDRAAVRLVIGPGWVSIFWGAGILLVAVAGARTRLSDIAPAGYAMVTRPDVLAMAWIQAETPPTARFLINSFPAYAGTAVVGADAGWWIPLLGHRAASVPPLLYMTENEPFPGFRSQLLDLTTAVQQKSLENPDVVELLDDFQITHIYIGQQNGRVNWNGPVLDPLVLLENNDLKLVYHVDRVWIFERTSFK